MSPSDVIHFSTTKPPVGLVGLVVLVLKVELAVLVLKAALAVLVLKAALVALVAWVVRVLKVALAVRVLKPARVVLVLKAAPVVLVVTVALVRKAVHKCPLSPNKGITPAGLLRLVTSTERPANVWRWVRKRRGRRVKDQTTVLRGSNASSSVRPSAVSMVATRRLALTAHRAWPIQPLVQTTMPGSV